MNNVTDEMVNRFLTWTLPIDFMPDCGVSFTGMNHPTSWPTGTNLLNAHQARTMLEHVVGAAAPAAQRADEPERMGLDAIRAAIEDRDAMEAKYHGLAEHMVYHGNSVSWWHSKATAYRDAVGKVWDELKAAGIVCDGKKTSAEGVRELAKLAAPAAPAYVPLSDREIAGLMLDVDDPLIWGRLGEGQGDIVRQFSRAIESLVVARMRGEGK